MLNELISYAKGMNAASDVLSWIETTLKKHGEKNALDQTECEHILDYLCSDKRPKRVGKMSYAQAKANTDKWNAALVKKGCAIDEKPEDVKVLKDFGDGFKIVQLVGENAYKREGFLMRHCVASYYGREVEVFSLRDKDNMPHCTMEKDKQIKGKGNGPIHPNYIGYIVSFLEEVGMSVGDNEMKNLGYVNVEKIKDKLHTTKNRFYKNYLPVSAVFYGLDGEEYQEFDVLRYKPLVVKCGLDVKFNFDLSVFLPVCIKKAISVSSTAVANRERSTAVANGENSTAVANRENSTAVANSWNSTAVANRENSTAVADGCDSTAVANGYHSTAVANGYHSTAVANGENSTAVADGCDSTAVANRWDSTAVANGENSLAVCRGSESKAKGRIGAWLVLSEWDDKKENIINVLTAKVDGVNIKEDVFYCAKDGQIVEAEQ